MRVRIIYVVDVNDGYRRAIKHYYGEEGLATRTEVQAWFEAYGLSMDDDLRYEHSACCWGDKEEAQS